MIPEKLQSGDEIRIISPSRSLDIVSKECQDIARENLEALGLKISFSKNVNEKDEFFSSSIESRVSDIHDAFSDKNVKGILTSIGGFNVNQILGYLDYELIKNNPKVICGFSDITALSNAIYQKTGLVNYSGLHFSSFGMKKGLEYSIEYFKKCLFDGKSFLVEASGEWSDDQWYIDQEKREFIKNDGFILINEGEAEGKILGGNLCTFNLLHGTEFMPDLDGSILFIEDDEETYDAIFDRDLQSLIHQPGFSKAKAIVFGRFQKASKMKKEKLIKIIKTKKELNNIPIIADVDFGHTTPQITFPIGGTAKLMAERDKIELKIINH